MAVEKIEKGAKISISVNEEFANFYNRFIEQNEFDEFSNPREVFQLCLEKVNKKLSPKIPEETQKRMTALETEIGKLFEENKELNQNWNSLNAVQKSLIEKNSELQEERKTLLQELQSKECSISALQTQNSGMKKLAENQYIIEISPIQFNTLQYLIKDKSIKALYRKYNQNGKLKHLIEPIETSDNEIQNIANLMLNTVMARELSFTIQDVDSLGNNRLKQAYRKYRESLNS